MAVSNTKETKLYRLLKCSSSGKVISSKRVRLPGACSPPAHALAFAADGRRLVVAAAAGDIRIVDLDLGVAKEKKDGTAAGGGVGRLVHCFEEHVDGVKPGGGDEGILPVSAVTLSASGKWLVSASVSGVVYVFDLVGLRHHWTAPRYMCMSAVGGYVVGGLLRGTESLPRALLLCLRPGLLFWAIYPVDYLTVTFSASLHVIRYFRLLSLIWSLFVAVGIPAGCDCLLQSKFYRYGCRCVTRAASRPANIPSVEVPQALHMIALPN